MWVSPARKPASSPKSTSRTQLSMIGTRRTPSARRNSCSSSSPSGRSRSTTAAASVRSSSSRAAASTSRSAPRQSAPRSRYRWSPSLNRLPIATMVEVRYPGSVARRRSASAETSGSESMSSFHSAVVKNVAATGRRVPSRTIQ